MGTIADQQFVFPLVLFLFSPILNALPKPRQLSKLKIALGPGTGRVGRPPVPLAAPGGCAVGNPCGQLGPCHNGAGVQKESQARLSFL